MTMNNCVNDDPQYFDLPIAEFRGNPLVEVLQPPPMNVEDALIRLQRPPAFNESERELPACYRALLLPRLMNFMFPTQQHVSLLQKIYSQILNGYRQRNPMTAEGQRRLHGGNTVPPVSSPANISFLTGLSGMGKTTLINSIMLAMGKPVIKHSCYKGTAFTESQILYLHRNVPDQCSAKALCKSFGNRVDELLGVELYSKHFSTRTLTRSDYVDALRKMIATQHIGALIIDEFQNISLAKSGGKGELIALIINLRDELGIPIVLVGTYRAAALLKDDASTARRLVEGGFHELKRPAGPSDENWRSLCEIVWDYQWVLDPLPFSDEIVETLYRHSQGITGIMLNLFVTAQAHALETGIETITPQLITEVYQERFSPLHGLINILSTNEPALLANYDDLYFDSRKVLGADPMQARLEAIRAEMDQVEKQLVNMQPATKKAAKPSAGRVRKPSEETLRSLLGQNGHGADDIFSKIA
jgi:hypothetical protein